MTLNAKIPFALRLLNKCRFLVVIYLKKVACPTIVYKKSSNAILHSTCVGCMNVMITRMAKDSRSNMVKCHMKSQQNPAHGSFGRTTKTFKSNRRWLLRRTGGLYHQYSSPVSTTVLPRGNKHHLINISVKLLVLTLLQVDCTC